MGTPSKSRGRQNSPTPTGVRRCQTRECRSSQNRQNLSLSGPTWIMKIIGWTRPCRQQPELLDLLARLLPAPKNIKKKSLPQSSKISKNRTLDAQCFNFNTLLMPSGPPFSINFRDHLNLSNCNNCNAKTSFLQCQASHFGIKKH